jgi:hypothetical protein
VRDVRVKMREVRCLGRGHIDVARIGRSWMVGEIVNA